jgi:AmmeMemoRadiSam system protein B
MSLEDPKDPSRPGRIILPGSEPVAPAEAPRIVLPPGASLEEHDDLPEYPRMRPLMLVPFADKDRELLLVSDPLGVIPGQPVLGIEALAILQLLDGSVTVNDITAALMRESKDIRIGNMVREFIRQLDDLLMLDSPKFQAAYRALREAYHPLEIRHAALEGHSYPAERGVLEAFLDSNFAQAEKLRAAAGEPVAAADARPRALLAPHLDPRRAGATMARAYLELGAEPPDPLRIVVLGTGHSLQGDLFALTRKHYQTPLGKLECDTAFVDTLAAALGEDPYHAELAHRDEHSIEFQALYLQRHLGTRPVRIVPILCGGFGALLDQGLMPHEDERVERFVAALRATEWQHGGDTVYVGAIDLSHVGPRFGDPRLDERMRKEVEEKDRAALAAAQNGDAEGWFQAVAGHDDSTRNCGFAPTYLLLRACEPGLGRLLRYQQSDEPDGSMVSTAAMVWP